MKKNEGRFFFSKRYPYHNKGTLEELPYPTQQVIFHYLLFTWKEKPPISHWFLLVNPQQSRVGK